MKNEFLLFPGIIFFTLITYVSEVGNMEFMYYLGLPFSLLINYINFPTDSIYSYLFSSFSIILIGIILNESLIWFISKKFLASK